MLFPCCGHVLAPWCLFLYLLCSGNPPCCQVVWRRISTATYAAFVCRVLGWPPDASAGLERHVATRVIAVALVRGHDPTAVPRAAAQRK